MKQELFSIEETCEILNCGRTYLYFLIKEGRLAAVKMGKKTLIKREVIEEYLASLPSYSSSKN